MSVDFVDYFELRSVWVRGCGNGNVRKLNPFEKGFFRACLIYTKINGVITNKTVLDMLRRVVELLTVTPHKEALKIGFEKVKNLIKNTALKSMFPKMLE